MAAEPKSAPNTEERVVDRRMSEAKAGIESVWQDARAR
jgi:hypothetical protein